MPDEFFSQNPQPAFTAPQRRSGGGRVVLAALLLLLVIIVAGVGWAVWRGIIPLRVDETSIAGNPADSAQPVTLASSPAAAPTQSEADALARQDALDARMAALEQRLDAVDVHAEAASGNAARAEALLVAFAARRALDRGAPLGFLEDQLRLRFGDAQPNAVTTVIDAARSPVTIDQLLTGLDTLAPSLTEAPASDSAWDRIKQQFSSLFVIRHDSAPSPAPTAMLNQARTLLAEGKVTDAIEEVQRLPGASASGAGDWMIAARRYDSAHRALDLLETTAMLDTRGLKDGSGSTVNQPSPITPTPAARP